MNHFDEELFDNRSVRERILAEAARLFSQKGYDATRISEIADAANMNKALLYYYFKNKEDVLGTLLGSVGGEFSAICKEYSNDADAKETKNDCEKARKYFSKMVDCAVENRAIFRIIMSESLNRGRSHGALDWILQLGKDAAQGESVAGGLFFMILPIINFAAYYDDCKALYDSEEKLKRAFVESLFNNNNTPRERDTDISTAF